MSYIDLAYFSSDYCEAADKDIPIEEVETIDESLTWVDVKKTVYIPGRSLTSHIGFYDFMGLEQKTYEWLLDNCDVSTVKIYITNRQVERQPFATSESRVAMVGFKNVNDAMHFKLSNDL